MKRLRLTSLLAIPIPIAATAAASADFVGASVEQLNTGFETTHRVYLQFDDPGDQLLRVGGTPYLLVFNASSELANNGGPFEGTQQEDFATCPFAPNWDSWVTIGHERLAGNDTEYDDEFCGGTDCSGSGRRVVGSSWVSEYGWFDADPDTTPVVPDEDGRVLIAQLTLEAFPVFSLEGTVTWKDARGDIHDAPFFAGGAWACYHDLDGDETFGFGDLLLLLARWGPLDTCEMRPEDINGDGTIGFSDLLGLLEVWGRSCPK